MQVFAVVGVHAPCGDPPFTHMRLPPPTPRSYLPFASFDFSPVSFFLMSLNGLGFISILIGSSFHIPSSVIGSSHRIDSIVGSFVSRLSFTTCLSLENRPVVGTR